MKWKLDRFLDNEHGNILKESYQAALQAEWNKTTQSQYVTSMPPEALVNWLPT
jgi:hypothetical protein